MKFEEIKVRKINLEKSKDKINAITKELKEAKGEKEAIAAVKKMFKFSDKLETDATVVSIKHSIDMNDKKIAKISDSNDIVLPQLGEASNEFDKAFLNSKFRAALEKKFGKTIFDRTEMSLKLFDPKIVEDQIKENQLTNEYAKIISGAKIEFNGEIHNMSSIVKFMSDKDRETRISAAHAYYGYLEEHDKELGQIYDDLVKVRTKIAKTLGFNNAIEFFYKRMQRFDYDQKMVKSYRDQIYNDVVPIATKIYRDQAKRIGIKKPVFVDFNLFYADGNAKPKGDSKYLVKCASKMYHEIGDDIGNFFDKMDEDNLLDLDAKPGKMTGGYMTYIPSIKMPFVFSNSNGTAQDVDTLTHEIGHAFQGFLGSKITVPSYRMPTMEACEIDSMSMEFFAEPWMELFFKEEADKYRYHHLCDAFTFLPYGCEVDEFQHWVYENPEATHDERCKKWAEIDHKYRPAFNYDGFEYAQGHLWMRQAHIFQSPFYYIDYTLAQVLALDFKNMMEKDREKAWNKYVKLLKLGGKYHFQDLLAKAHLRNPFGEGQIKKIVRPQVKKLKEFDGKF